MHKVGRDKLSKLIAGRCSILEAAGRRGVHKKVLVQNDKQL